MVLVASKGGDDRILQLYRNLIAHPDIELTMACECLDAGPPGVTAGEGGVVAPVAAAYTGYGGCQRRTERDIPLVICEPR